MHPLNEAVAAYLPLVESLARQHVGIQGVEYDDLVQEGLIAVWLTLEADGHPSAVIVRNRMIDWIRYVRRQLPADYEDMLPLEALVYE